jgi:hypothetical protein
MCRRRQYKDREGRTLSRFKENREEKIIPAIARRKKQKYFVAGIPHCNGRVRMPKTESPLTSFL